MKFRISFEIDLPIRRVAEIQQYGSLPKQVKKFINDAITSWGGSFHPDDPLFESLPKGKKFKVQEVVTVNSY